MGAHEKLIREIAMEINREHHVRGFVIESAELILRERLLPILEAGQAMRDCNYINDKNSMAWDAAVAPRQK